MAFNSISVLGRLAHTAKFYPGNADKKAMIMGTIAVEENYIRRANKKPDTDFLPFRAWGSVAELIQKNTVQGSPLFLSGSLETTSSDGMQAIFINVGQVQWFENKALLAARVARLQGAKAPSEPHTQPQAGGPLPSDEDLPTAPVQSNTMVKQNTVDKGFGTQSDIELSPDPQAAPEATTPIAGPLIAVEALEHGHVRGFHVATGQPVVRDVTPDEEATIQENLTKSDNEFYLVSESAFTQGRF